MDLKTYTAGARGRLAKLCRDIGAYAPDVSRWANGSRPVPPRWCVAIERITDGAVSRRDLRPDDWHLIWPELAEAHSAVLTEREPA
ncbi:MAG: YdaS family helix-turn-helix protein [Burkholderia gladioli]